MLGLATGCSDASSVPAGPVVAVSASSALVYDTTRSPRVDVRVNGSAAGALLLDPARNVSCLTPAAADQLALAISQADRDDEDQRPSTRCTLRFAEVHALDWTPRIDPDPVEGAIGVLGQDVLGRLQWSLDADVGELRFHPPGGLTRELAGFAAAGWTVLDLPLVPLEAGPLGVQARPRVDPAQQAAEAGSSGAESFEGALETSLPEPDREQAAPAFLRVDLRRRETVVPARFLQGRRAAGSVPELSTARLDVHGRLLRVRSARTGTEDEARLGSAFLGAHLVGWDGPGRTLYLATLPGLAESSD